MATLYITELFGYQKDNLQVAVLPKVTDQTVAIGGSSTQSSAFNVNTRLVRLCADQTCSIEVASNPTATTTTARLPANIVEYFEVMPGMKIAVITNS